MNNTDEQKVPGSEQEHESIKAGKEAIAAANEVDKSKPAPQKNEEEQADAEKWRNEG